MLDGLVHDDPEPVLAIPLQGPVRRGRARQQRGQFPGLAGLEPSADALAVTAAAVLPVALLGVGLVQPDQQLLQLWLCRGPGKPSSSSGKWYPG